MGGFRLVGSHFERLNEKVQIGLRDGDRGGTEFEMKCGRADHRWFWCGWGISKWNGLMVN